jgi:dimethylhistidine N-methyltransferase
MLNAPLPSLAPFGSRRSAALHPPKSAPIVPHQADLAEFRDAVLAGLGSDPKRLPCRYFYDCEGSRLFDAICDQPEYYLTRTEDQILRSAGPNLAALIPADVSLVELGSGTARKTRHVIAALLARQKLLRYYPADICAEMLQQSARALTRDFPRLEVIPVEGEYYSAMQQLREHAPSPRLLLFLGSNLGNFKPDEADRFLGAVRGLLGPDDHFLLSLDAVKPVKILEAAYDDAAGITARFNLNLLQRINRELEGDFNLRAWQHQAFYDRHEARIEMHLCSLADQEVHLAGRTFRFRPFETIHTEDSHKYTREHIEALADRAELDVVTMWTDPKDWFRVTLLRPRAAG